MDALQKTVKEIAEKRQLIEVATNVLQNQEDPSIRLIVALGKDVLLQRLTKLLDRKLTLENSVRLLSIDFLG